VAEENLKIPMVPVMNKKFMIGSFIMKKHGMHEISDE